MPRALLIDLYNTLVFGGDDGRAQMTRDMGVDLGVDPDKFAWLVRHTWHDRMTGVYGNPTIETAALAGQLDGTPAPAAISAAVERRLAFARASLVPGSAPINTMTALREAGWKIAIVSNCTYDSALALRATPLATAVDALVLSCEVKLGKPDPAMYLAACAALGDVDPTDCVFVGDGADHELDGAVSLGMRVIQTSEYRVSDPDWVGERIASITDLVALLSDQPG
jgi:putative hydrolase of the HAD superfamily